MTSRFVNPKRKQTQPRLAHVVIAGLAALIAAGDHAGATGDRSERSVESIESRAAGEPIMAIVSLHNQRITVYDANGWILRAPVSSGSKGRETPAGIFSVIQKNAEHYSNLYDDAYIPTCNASPGRESRSTAVLCQVIRRPMAASGCPSTSQHACSTRRGWACG
jgi:lipoprotein-anchoring transpeptidase ErfK/SrfK